MDKSCYYIFLLFNTHKSLLISNEFHCPPSRIPRVLSFVFISHDKACFKKLKEKKKWNNKINWKFSRFDGKHGRSHGEHASDWKMYLTNFVWCTATNIFAVFNVWEKIFWHMRAVGGKRKSRKSHIMKKRREKKKKFLHLYVKSICLPTAPAKGGVIGYEPRPCAWQGCRGYWSIVCRRSQTLSSKSRGQRVAQKRSPDNACNTHVITIKKAKWNTFFFFPSIKFLLETKLIYKINK